MYIKGLECDMKGKFWLKILVADDVLVMRIASSGKGVFVNF